MANTLNMAANTLLTLQRALSVTGHNISNVNTDGYSRQSVEYSSLNPQKFGQNYIGSGVTLASVTRNTDDFVTQQLRNAITSHSQYESFLFEASSVDGLLATPGSSVSESMQEFFSALQQAVSSPDSAPVRNALFNQSQLLVSQFQSMDQRLLDQGMMLNQKISTVASQVNSIAQGIADLNAQMVNSGSPPADLLDKRDQLVNQMSKLVDVNVINQSDGTITVGIGSGHMLVVGAVSNTLKTSQSSVDPMMSDIFIKMNGADINISDGVTGGQLGGLLAFRNDVLTPTRNQLGTMALAYGDSFNQQHQLGMDINGNLGKEFFNDINSATAQSKRVISNKNNTGTAQLGIEITDVDQLSSSDYRLSVSAGPNYTVVRLSDQQVFNFASFPQTIDGMNIQLTAGSANAGDTFILAPTRTAASDLSLNINSSQEIALASPIRTSALLANQGSASMSAGTVTDISTADFATTPGQLTPPVRIEFLSPTSFQIVNATTSGVIEGPIVYDPANTNNVFPTPGAYDPGYRISLSGGAATGDVFTVDYNSGGVGDSRNALLLSDLQNARLLDNGQATYQDVYASMISDVGSLTYQAGINEQASSILEQQVQSRRDSTSGVNLDEEAARLLQFELAYQAASKVISVAKRLFDILFQTVGR